MSSAAQDGALELAASSAAAQDGALELAATQSDELAATQADAADAATDTDGDDDDGAPAVVYGRLLGDAASSSASLQLAITGEASIGRAPNCSLRLDDPRVSSSHAKLDVMPNGGDGAPAIILIDSSSNGTWLNGARLAKGEPTSLKHLDELAFGNAPETAKSRFVFTAAVFSTAATTTTTAQAAAASSAAAAASSSNDNSTSGGGASSSAGVSLDESEVEKELICGICQDILYKPVALQPCLHVFCGACFCTWLKRKSDCPQCRKSVSVVSRNHAIGNIVDAFLTTHPHRRRDKEERDRLDTEDTLGNEPKHIRKRDRDEGADLDDYDDSDGEEGDSDDDDGVGGLFPLGFPPGLFANNPFLAQHLARTTCPGCSLSVPASQVQRIADRQPLMLPPRALPNQYEMGILDQHLRRDAAPGAPSVSPAALLQRCLARVAAGTMTMPNAPASGTPFTADSSVCHRCFEGAFKALVYEYRASIPPAELPDAVRSRQNCWYGTGCRTQTHNPSHCERLNHICPPSGGKGGGKGRGGGAGGGGLGRGRGGGGGDANPPSPQPAAAPGDPAVHPPAMPPAP